jgi:hypothetical protein
MLTTVLSRELSSLYNFELDCIKKMSNISFVLSLFSLCICVPVYVTPLVLLGNGLVNMFLWQRVHTTIEELLDALIFTWSMLYQRKISNQFFPQLLVSKYGTFLQSLCLAMIGHTHRDTSVSSGFTVPAFMCQRQIQWHTDTKGIS